MEDFTFTPWHQVPENERPKRGPHSRNTYYVGTYATKWYIHNCFVLHECDWDRWRPLVTLRNGGGGEASWYVQKEWTLMTSDPAYDRMKWLETYVKENWWYIFTSCPLMIE